MDIGYIFSIILLALGFGFVIFWHELGHFLAAKWAGVKVEQFAVGFGTAIFSWRKGIGLRYGSTQQEYEKIVARKIEERRAARAHLGRDDGSNPDYEPVKIAQELGLGDTEYRLNWLPLGGYVKMLGQDDLNPNATATDPRAYNMQPIGKRMVIVSAGVIMNVFLAAVGFCVLFLIGFNSPPPIIGSVVPGSPAQLAQPAGLEVGDRIITIDGKQQHDFTKIWLTVALLGDGETVPVEIDRPGVGRISTTVRPSRMAGDTRGMLSLGITPPYQLVGLDPDKLAKDDKFDPLLDSARSNAIQPGEVVVAIEGQDVQEPDKQFYLLDRALQRAQGKPVTLQVRDRAGATHQRLVHPTFDRLYAETSLDFAGMLPRASVLQVMRESPAREKILPDDVVVSIKVTGNNDVFPHPSREVMIDTLDKAGNGGNSVVITMLRNGKEVELEPIVPNVKLETGKRGLGLALRFDDEHAVVAGIAKDSPAFAAAIPQGATIESINDIAVANWFDVVRSLQSAEPDRAVNVVFRTSSDKTDSAAMKLSTADISKLRSFRYAVAGLAVQEYKSPRRTKSPFEAAMWGVEETRDLITQFYLTIRRMIERSVPASNMMGPLGIVQAGSRFAYKGNDWLIWFLSMISANLAVVNFLPIPIVDGGLFLFLLIEKLQGRPLSARTQSIAQVIGLALILSVFVFVTYQDIIR